MPIGCRVVFLALLVGCGGRSISIEGDESEQSAGSPGSSGSSGASGSSAAGSSGSASGGSDVPPSGGTGPSSTGGNGSGSAGEPSSGGTSSDNGGTGSGNGGTSSSTGGSAGSVDPNCYPGLAVSGAECTEACSIPCGLGELGTRTCQCTGGYYSSCHCPRPPGYLGAPTAPPCDTPDGRALPLRHLACDVEWAQCIGNDPVEGSIPRGCACLKNPLNGDRLTWFCGSTSRWFSPE